MKPVLSLLATKLRPPSIQPDRVQRPRLIQRLNQGLETGRRITLVSAPAGFGKTTCIGEWLLGLEGPYAWLSLDPADDDPGRFFSYLVAALQQIDRDLGGEIENALRSGQLPQVEALSATLINDLLEVRDRFILILDDFHVIQDRLILQVLEQLIANQPPSLHLVLITREDPPLPLARVRANNQLTEVRASDLRFTGGEADRFLNEVMNLALSQVDIAVLEERTEGWIAGLQLAGLSVRDRENPSAFIAGLSGSHRYILSYLTEEVLSRQPPEIQNFLLQTSILDRLSGDLCNALTGRTDSKTLLERLFKANLFLVPLDDEGQWYRYHHLFADLLRDRQDTLHKDRTAELHRRASRWYRTQGMINEAVQHALAAADFAMAVRLLESHATELIIQGYGKTVEGWLDAIPPEFSSQSPKANLAFAWMYLLSGAVAQAAPYIERLGAMFSPQAAAPAGRQPGEGASTQQPPALRAEWLAMQSNLLAMDGKLAESLDLARQALEIAPAEDNYVRSLAYNALGSVYLLMDDYEGSVETYRKAILHGRSASNFILEMMAISVLAQIAIQHGHNHFADEIASQGIERVELLGSPPALVSAVHGALGQASYQWNQIEKSRGHFLRALELCSRSGYVDGQLYSQAFLSRLHQTEGDLEAAAREIEPAIDLMRSGAPAWIRPEVISQQVRIELARGRLAEAEMALGSEGFSFQEEFSFPDLPPGQKVNYQVGLTYNSALRVLLHRAQTRGAIDSLEPGIALADSLIKDALEGRYLSVALEILLLRAQMMIAMGNDQAALADITRALELGEPEGFIRVFVDEGAPVAGALEALLEQDRLVPVPAEYARKILDAFSELPQPGAALVEQAPARSDELHRIALVEPLTARELEVLRLISEGCSNQEIAGRLVITVRTVKKHASNIYGKLNVGSRTQAVARARELGLLPAD